MLCSGMESMAAPSDPPKTRNNSGGLKYAPIAPSEAWNMEKSTAPHASTRPMIVARSIQGYFG